MTKPKFNLKNKFNRLDLLFLLILLCQIILLYVLQNKATTDALGSPWPIFGSRFFWFYGFSTAILIFYSFVKTNKYLWLVSVSIHYLISLGIITFVYPLGWGYDPFLHRAAEKYIFEFGAAIPKTPFYIGQYVIVNILAHLTNLPIKIIDIYLVPVLSSILLPISVYFGTRYGLKLSEKLSRLSAIIILLYPFKTMVVTTPYNLANTFTLTSIFLSLLMINNKKNWIPSLLFAVLAVLTHPLVGIFAIILFILILLNKILINKKRIVLSVISVVSFFIIPILFIIYGQIGGTNIEIVFNLDNFINLFREPYYFINRPAHWILDLVYLYRFFIPGIIIAFSISVFMYKEKKGLYLYLLMSLIILINVFILSSFIKFKQLNSFEQIQYSQRLIHSCLFFILPLFIIGLIKTIRLVKNKKNIYFVTLFALSIPLTTSLYLSYPQKNPIVHFPAYNVTDSDYTAIEYINNSAGDHDYVVLSNILTAAAAIEKYGFSNYFDTDKGKLFYYSIPSGSPLAELYSKMLYKGQQRIYMEKAMELTKTNKSFFVMTSYWHNSKEIINGAKNTADSWYSIDNKVWVFEYFK
ncbi:MAG: hypothetical protein GF349_03220 [Candidatus Magasanikbacteria bacterium]|nr:hypothetical protein [Candidatus Magasanikbacteria bacterium]